MKTSIKKEIKQMPTQKFKEDLKIGRKGEELVIDILTARGWALEDFQNNMDMQRKGIDFKVSKDEKEFTIEVKYDIKSEDTGNFFIETEQHKKPGFLHTTQADWLFLCNNKTVYVVSPASLRNYYATRKAGTVCGGDNSKGYLLRESALRKIAAQVILIGGVF
jgi:hypothetical protein